MDDHEPSDAPSSEETTRRHEVEVSRRVTRSIIDMPNSDSQRLVEEASQLLADEQEE